MGVYIANCKVVLEAARRVKVLEEKAKEDKDQSNKDKQATVEVEAIKAFAEWKRQGKPVNAVAGGTSTPKLCKAASIAILKVLLPIIAKDESMKEYSSMKKCCERLAAIAGGSSWEREMEAFVVKFSAEKGFDGIDVTERLF